MIFRINTIMTFFNFIQFIIHYILTFIMGPGEFLKTYYSHQHYSHKNTLRKSHSKFICNFLCKNFVKLSVQVYWMRINDNFSFKHFIACNEIQLSNGICTSYKHKCNTCVKYVNRQVIKIIFMYF